MKLFKFEGRVVGDGEMDDVGCYVRAEDRDHAFRLVNENWGWDETADEDDPDDTPEAIAERHVDDRFDMIEIKTYPADAKVGAEVVDYDEWERVLHAGL